MNNIGGYHIAKERGVYSGPAPAKPAPKPANPAVLRPPLKLGIGIRLITKCDPADPADVEMARLYALKA